MGVFDFLKGYGFWKNKRKKEPEVDLEVLYNEALKRDPIPEVIEGDRLVSINDCNIQNGVYVIPKNVKRIDSWAFKDQKNLRKVVFHDDVEYISGFAFDGCCNLVELEGLEDAPINNFGGFGNCESLERITLPETTQIIGWNAFSGCKKLKEVVIPDGCWAISPFAFEKCVSLNEIRLPAQITVIHSTAFKKCKNTNVIFPNYGEYADLGFFEVEINGEMVEYPAGDVMIENCALDDVGRVVCYDQETFGKVAATGYNGRLAFCDDEQKTVVEFDMKNLKKQLEEDSRENGK